MADYLLARGGPVAAWSHRRAAAVHDRGASIEWQSVDLLDSGRVADAIAALRPSAIFHCAGVPHVAESWSDPARALQVNVIGTHHLFEGLRRANHVCPVVVAGSALVYRQSPAPLTEDDPIGPASPYGLSKLAQEMVALRATGVPVFLARPFNHAGPRQAHSFVTSSFAKQIAEIEAGLTEPMLRVGNLEARRDIMDVRDTVRAYHALVERGRPRRPYNVCAGQAYRVRDLLDMLLGLSSASVRIVEDRARMRPSDNPLLVGDRSRIADETGWRPEIPIERTLGDLLDYWRTETARPALPAP